MIMAAESRKPSAERTIGLVPCPACAAVGTDCLVCGGTHRVSVDAAVKWRLDPRTRRPSLPPEQGLSDADKLLLDSIDYVLGRVIDREDNDDAKALIERAVELNDIVANWQHAEPSSAERHDVTNKVLGLHVALGRFARGQRK